MWHIIDENNEIIDSSKNAFFLKMTCGDMNSRNNKEYQIVSEDELVILLERAKVEDFSEAITNIMFPDSSDTPVSPDDFRKAFEQQNKEHCKNANNRN